MFGNKLEEAVTKVDGGQAAIIMGFDGIPVDMYASSDDPDIETVGMEFSVLLKEVRKASELLGSGETQEVMVRSEKLSTILRVVNGEYFLAITVKPSGNIGKARFLLRLLAPELKRELS